MEWEKDIGTFLFQITGNITLNAGKTHKELSDYSSFITHPYQKNYQPNKHTTKKEIKDQYLNIDAGILNKIVSN